MYVFTVRSSYIVGYSYITELDISTELFLHRLIINRGGQDTSPNVEIALRIYLILMASNFAASALSQNSNELRTDYEHPYETGTVCNVNLAIMSIVSDVLS